MLQLKSASFSQAMRLLANLFMIQFFIAFCSASILFLTSAQAQEIEASTKENVRTRLLDECVYSQADTGNKYIVASCSCYARKLGPLLTEQDIKIFTVSRQLTSQTTPIALDVWKGCQKQ